MNRFEYTLLLLPIILASVGIVVLSSLDAVLFRQQLIFLIFATFVYFIFLAINYTFFNYYSFAIYAVIFVTLVISFIIGVEARGAVRWIEIFGIRVQFSEVFKPFFILFYASYLSKTDTRSFSKFAKGLILFVPLFFLILRQPDLGNALIYLGTLIAMYLFYGFPIRYFIILLLLVAVPFPYLFSHLHDYQKQRVETFFNVTSDPFGSSYNAVQSIIAIGSGELFGKGYGHATQSILKFLPERHTDFMFATFSETFGFVGIVILLTLYGLLFCKINSIASSLKDTFSYLAVIGIFFLTLIHVFFNIGMNLAVLPIVGITLPFLSYGGSSLVTNFILMGMVSSFAREGVVKRSVEIR